MNEYTPYVYMLYHIGDHKLYIGEQSAIGGKTSVIAHPDNLLTNYFTSSTEMTKRLVETCPNEWIVMKVAVTIPKDLPISIHSYIRKIEAQLMKQARRAGAELYNQAAHLTRKKRITYTKKKQQCRWCKRRCAWGKRLKHHEDTCMMHPDRFTDTGRQLKKGECKHCGVVVTLNQMKRHVRACIRSAA